jgi:predicted DNA-binding transcriptional regulator YafY
MKSCPSSDPLTQVLRLFTILQLLGARRSGAPLGRQRLADACDCSVKTIARDMGRLLQLGIPIEYDPVERAYMLPEKSRVPMPVLMTATDAMALALARGLLADAALPFAAELGTALDKATAGLSAELLSLLHSASQALHAQGGLARDYSQAPLRLLLRAMTRRETVEMLYESRSGGTKAWRRVDPYRLDHRDGRYLELNAWCHTRRTVRTFALDRIAEARLTGERFERRAWEAQDEGVVGGLRGGPMVEAVVRFDSEVALFAKEHNWPFAATFTPGEEGSVIMRCRVQGVEGMVKEMLSWRHHAEVLGGPELRASFVAELRAMANIYMEG